MDEQQTSAVVEPPKRKHRKPLNAEHREARAALILARKLANARTEDICKEFQLSRATVYRALSDARKMGLLTQARDWLTLNIVPLSLAAIEEALLTGDIPVKVDTAFRVLDGLGITGKHAILEIKGGGGGETFDEFRATVIKRVRRNADGSPAAQDVHTMPANEVVDGVLQTAEEEVPGTEALALPDMREGDASGLGESAATASAPRVGDDPRDV